MNVHHPERVTATTAARDAIAALRAARGPVMFVQSDGGRGGSVPLCFPAGEFLVDPHDVLLGQIDGAAFYLDARLDEEWGHGNYVLDVADGEPETFSLPAGSHRHFVTHVQLEQGVS
ncbi:DUF779 domain-containing protein [Amycolatopsis benzoatilytica]|uniref:DUF779 domain-containing protein n=1 Tax=Amycolatopsis benzoatilytica TaxID=346045 RepID=UPI00037CADA6|nr:DUF779 domain-containing protein [Amycolatopsis benzoatilytica]